jgi:pyruvate kinase
MRKTKIICTIGPKTDTFEQIEKLAEAGMDVVRLNMSHATHATAAKVIRAVKTLNRKRDNPIAILLDTQGPEIRTGDLADELELKTGSEITISVRDGGDVEASSIRIHYDDLVSALKVGDRITVDNGIINLEVLAKNENGTLRC